MAIVDRHGLPLSVSTHAANHHEVSLVQLCFDFYMIEAKPENLIGDRAYDSDPLDQELHNGGIEMIAPHRSNSRPGVERSLYARANGFHYEAVKIFMPAGAKTPVYAPYVEYVPPDTTAAIFWLKHRDPPAPKGALPPGARPHQGTHLELSISAIERVIEAALINDSAFGIGRFWELNPQGHGHVITAQ
jgi:hypothetical protein